MDGQASNNMESLDAEKEPNEQARIEIIGEVNPKVLTREEFGTNATLFHGARDSNFQVHENFDYNQSIVDDSTLGSGLYTTADHELAERYAQNRPGGTMWKLVPYNARMLNLTSKDQLKNLSFPRELVFEWIDFAQPVIMERARSSESKPEVRQRLLDVLRKMNDLPTKDFIDLRVDILDTGSSPFSVIDDVWKDFCREKGWDGVVFVEGGDGDLTRKNDRTYVFYNATKIGTYEDWQQRQEV